MLRKLKECVLWIERGYKFLRKITLDLPLNFQVPFYELNKLKDMEL